MANIFTFDPVGNLTANRISNEPHTVSIINGVDHNYLIPVNAPFYDISMTVIEISSGQSLVENVDFFFAYPFEQATDKVGEPISGAIVFLDPNRSGAYSLNYQTLGGEYVNQTTQAISDGLDILSDLRLRKWADIINLPAVFPPTPHTHRLAEVAGVAEILAMFSRLETAIRSPERNIHMADIVDLNTGFVEPIQLALSEVSAAIQVLSATKSIHHVERYTDGTNQFITPLVADQWLPVGLAVTVQQDGTYIVNMNGNPLIMNVNGLGQYDWAFQVNSITISKSTLNGAYVGLSVGDIVSLMIKIPLVTPVSIQVSGTDIATSISLLKVGP